MKKKKLEDTTIPEFIATPATLGKRKRVVRKKESSATVVRRARTVVRRTAHVTVVSMPTEAVVAPLRTGVPRWKFAASAVAVFAMAIVVVTSNNYNKAPAAHSATITNGLVAAWDFEGVKSSTVSDTSGNGNTATLSKATVSSGALTMSSANSFATVKNSNSIALTSSMTFSAWVNVSDFATWRGIMGKTRSNIPNPYDWYLSATTGKPSFLVGNGTRYSQIAAITAPTRNQWQHLAVVVSGKTVTHYLNGVANGTGTISAPIRNNRSKPVYLGSRDDKVTQMKGSMDDIKMFNRALSSSEVKSLADTPRTNSDSVIRDTQRKKDLNEIKAALEGYYKANNTYRVAKSGWNNGSEGWVSYEDSASYARSVTRALKEAGLLTRAEYKDPQSTDPGYMMYICDDGKRFSLSATLEQPSASDVTTAEASCNGIGGNGTVPRYKKNYSVSGDRRGPIAQWSFEEGGGSKAADTTSFNNHGELQGGTKSVEGINGKGVEFTGSDGRFVVPNSPSLNPESITVSLWIQRTAELNCDTNNNWKSLFFKGAPADPKTGFGVVLEEDSTVAWDTSPYDRWWPGTVKVPLGQWTNLVFSYDATGVKKIYQDGVLKGKQTIAPGALQGNGSGLQFSQQNTACSEGQGMVPGVMDEITVWPRALEEAEVVDLHTAISKLAKTSTTSKLGKTATDGLVAHWKFDEGSGTSAADSSGNSNNGTLKGVATWTDGKAGKAVQLDGVDDYVDFGDAAVLQPQKVSVSVWFKTDGVGMILRKRLYGYGLEMKPTKQLSFWMYDTNAKKFEAISTNTYADNVWHHAIGMYDGTTVKLFVDGASVASTPVLPIHYVAGAIAVGRDGDNAGQYLKGAIDELKIYNRVLTAEEIGSTPSGPVAEWNFNDGSAKDAVASTDGVRIGTTSVDGKAGKAIALNGASDYVKVPYVASNPLFNLTSKLSYALWVKPQGKMPILIQRQQCNNAWPSAELSLVGSAAKYSVRFQLNYQHNNTYTTFDSPAVIPEHAWSHIAATYDKDAKLVKIYVNGEEVFSGTYDKTIWKPTTPLWIGGIPQPNGAPTCWQKYSKGTIDEVKVYDRAITAVEVKNLYTANASAPSVLDFTALGLVGEWKFDNGSLKDTKQNKDATNVGATAATDRNNLANNAYDFKSASHQYVNAGVADAYKMSQAVTMESWVYPTGSGGHTIYGGIIMNREREYEIARFGNGHIGYALANTTPGWVWTDTGYTAALNTWTHLVLTYSAADRAIVLYANGQEVYRNASATGLIGRYMPIVDEPWYEFRIGGRQYANVQEFDGKIDDVRLYNTALTADQVGALYASQTAPPQTQSSAQASYGSSSSSAMMGSSFATASIAPDIIATPDRLQFFAREGDALTVANRASWLQEVMLELSDKSEFFVKPSVRSLGNSRWLSKEYITVTPR